MVLLHESKDVFLNSFSESLGSRARLLDFCRDELLGNLIGGVGWTATGGMMLTGRNSLAEGLRFVLFTTSRIATYSY